MIFVDFEVFSNNWMLVGIDPFNRREYVLVDDREALEQMYREYKNDIFVGYNIRNYDQWIFKAILCGFNPKEVNDWIIVKDRKGHEFSSLLNKFTINFFDCMTTFNGLKTMEAFMGMNIKETSVPFDIDRPLTQSEIEETIKYCKHDVKATMEVFFRCRQEFDAHLGLIKMFHLPLSYLGKTKTQLSAVILGAKKTYRSDEFDIAFPPTMRISKYQQVVDWFKTSWNYDTKLEIDIAGVPHVFATGGIHGAIPNYCEEGEFLSCDVASYYPALMIEYPDDCASRSIPDRSKYREIRDTRIKYKREKNPMQAPLKIVLNSTYGAMKDKYNSMYDPRQANNVCVFGQLLLLDLIEHLEGHCDLIQSNTDGIIVKLHGNREEVVAICEEWSKRTRMGLEYDDYVKIIQRDVNNYVIVDKNGKYKSKGAVVKKLNDLDYDLPIVNEAVVGYLVHGVSVSTTINACDDLHKFQKVFKLSGKYAFVMHNGVKYVDKCYRVFASRDSRDTYIGKCKSVGATNEKFANSPDHCRIVNEEVLGQSVPRWLDKSWYINLAEKRVREFLGNV